MPTAKQRLGEFGETVVAKHCACPRCKNERTLRRLPTNFKCADLVCDFCGYLGQVKSKTAKHIDSLPRQLLGAAWGPQQKRMAAGIYFPLFIVLVSGKQFAIYYLAADLQTPDMFKPREPLSDSARRAGWQGFYYDLSLVPEGAIVRLK